MTLFGNSACASEPPDNGVILLHPYNYLLGGMKLVLTLLAIVVLLGADNGQPEEYRLQAIDDDNQLDRACGCDFNVSMPGVAEGLYGSGPLVFRMEPFVSDPYALVNIGNGDIKLSPLMPIELPYYECESGRVFRSEWRSEVIHIVAILAAESAGYEACWFSGTISSDANGRRSRVSVKGACGC